MSVITTPYTLKKVLIIVCLLLMSVQSFATTTDYWNQSNESNSTPIDHQSWQKVLDDYLITNHPSGVNRFRYRDVSIADKKILKEYLLELQGIDPRRYHKVEQMAYWINLYNALTVNLILDNYPVKSIKKLGNGFFSFGPWDDEVAEIAGHRLSLNDIEHKILRPIWQDLRIHYAVNCASYSCPNLSAKAFTSANTNMLLDQGASDYINHTRGVSFDKGELIVSSIYHWYLDDFGGNDQLLIKHLVHYAKPELKKQLMKFQGTKDHQYDWQLNESDKTH
ncbi:MAG TPA: DUF547 domain-containing protein [Thiotrichaceae bacterium]|nr:DUF547 domain-containing protein [Thiotrichaceae bacterium]HIL39565.1 DUF547 domain-containing protein [Methylococcales bacterium]